MAFFRRRKRRPRRPRGQGKPLLDGFTAAELGSKVGMSARAVRYYTAQHVLPAPQFHGPSTRYVREHLIRLAAIRYLQREHHYSLQAIRQHLEPLPATELERLAALVLPELAAPPTPAAPAAPTPAVPPIEIWHRLPVVPGLEIHVQAAAGAEVHALARRIERDVRDGKFSGPPAAAPVTESVFASRRNPL